VDQFQIAEVDQFQIAGTIVETIAVFGEHLLQLRLAHDARVGQATR
jgi:hypothetical protein